MFLEELTESFQVRFEDLFFGFLLVFHDFGFSIEVGFLSKRSKSFNYRLIFSISRAGFYEIAHLEGLLPSFNFPKRGL